MQELTEMTLKECELPYGLAKSLARTLGNLASRIHTYTLPTVPGSSNLLYCSHISLFYANKTIIMLLQIPHTRPQE